MRTQPTEILQRTVTWCLIWLKTAAMPCVMHVGTVVIRFAQLKAVMDLSLHHHERFGLWESAELAVEEQGSATDHLSHAKVPTPCLRMANAVARAPIPSPEFRCWRTVEMPQDVQCLDAASLAVCVRYWAVEAN